MKWKLGLLWSICRELGLYWGNIGLYWGSIGVTLGSYSGCIRGVWDNGK